MKKGICTAFLCGALLLSTAHAEIIPYFEFDTDKDKADSNATLHLIEDFKIPLAGPEVEEKATVVPSATPIATPTAALPEAVATPPPAATVVPTEAPAFEYPQGALDAMVAMEIDPADVIDLDQWWLEAESGESYEVEIGECVFVNGAFYKVIAECPPFEKSPGLTSYDLQTLINFMAGLFARVYPPV